MQIQPAKRRIILITVMGTFVVSLVLAFTDRRFYINTGYGETIRPTYLGHGLLFAAYAVTAFLVARAAIWKPILIGVIGASFGLWSLPVVDLALAFDAAPGFIRAMAARIDSLNGRAGTAALLTGILASGILMAGLLWALTKSHRVGLGVLGASLLAGLLAAQGWGEPFGPAASSALIFLSSVVWHTGVAAVLVLWAYNRTNISNVSSANGIGDSPARENVP